MSVDKYKFISPGIFVSEIDNTGRTAIPEDVGPAIIGRSEKGPILQPVRVESYFDFVGTFGNPIPGGQGGDVVRDGNYTSPTYASYAAQAWFRNNAPVTFVRLGGKTNQSTTDSSGPEVAGWTTTNQTPATSFTDNGGAWGLFVSDAPTQTVLTASLEVGDDVIAAGNYIRMFANNTERLFVSGTANSSGDAASMTFDATGSTPATPNEEAVAANIATVINLSSIPITANAIGAVVGLTASSDLATLSTGIDVGFDQAGGSDFDLLINNVAVGAAVTGTMSASYAAVTGTLAAVWYIDQSASIGLSGTTSATGEETVGSSIYFDSVGTKQFKAQISGSGGVIVDTTFDFSDTSENFLRKVFNTNPILTNSNAVKTTSNSFSRYWLGESYEGSVDEKLTGTGAGGHIGAILPLRQATDGILGGKFNKEYQDAKTGWFFAQDLNTGPSATGSFVVADQQKLFRLVARNSGDWVARNLKVSIKDLKASPVGTTNPYGSFSVVLRRLSDTDNRIEIVEQYNNCNLNPSSENYIGRKIGDKNLVWDDADRRYREFGDYPNLSKYVYVDVADEVKNADTDARYLPFGVQGPLRFNNFNDAASQGQVTDTIVSGNLDDMNNVTITTFISGAAATDGQVRFEFPELRLRISASEGDPVDPLNSFYGVDTTFDSSRLNASVRDYLKIKPTDVDDFATGSLTEVSFNFTLDDMCRDGAEANKVFAYKEGSRASTADRGGLTYLRGTGAYTEVLDAGVDRFTTVFHGGFDGLNIKESEPLRIVNDGTVASSVTANYMFNSVQVAIDSLRDPEVVEYNLAAMPGVVNSTLNTSLIDMCESRGDALAIVDVKGGYTPQYESTADEDSRKGSVSATVNELKTNLVINSSYGAAYYPWVQIRDLNNGQVVWAPPSVAAIGAMSYSQKASELWFAPAGFTRGGLSAGRGGLPVVGVRDRLTSRDRDTLYDNRVNPIAQFPAEGIVIFGQKTLQADASALDRINVRRLMIFLKRQISRFASTILFDQNVRVTWNRFKGQVEPFLRSVQAGLGITEFKLVLDETTTTPDLVDRNIMYAKIFIKPARAIEYIAIDFILTDSGAAFED
jgi:hypothetical protein